MKNKILNLMVVICAFVCLSNLNITTITIERVEKNTGLIDDCTKASDQSECEIIKSIIEGLDFDIFENATYNGNISDGDKLDLTVDLYGKDYYWYLTVVSEGDSTNQILSSSFLAKLSAAGINVTMNEFYEYVSDDISIEIDNIKVGDVTVEEGDVNIHFIDNKITISQGSDVYFEALLQTYSIEGFIELFDGAAKYEELEEEIQQYNIYKIIKAGTFKGNFFYCLNNYKYKYSFIVDIDPQYDEEEVIVLYEKNDGGYDKYYTTVKNNQIILEVTKLTSFMIAIFDEDGNPNDEPGDDEPGDDEPGNDEPGNDEPGNDEPGDDEPGDDEPELDDEPNTGLITTKSVLGVLGFGLLISLYSLIFNKKQSKLKNN